MNIVLKGKSCFQRCPSGRPVDRLEPFSGRRIKGLTRIHMQKFDTILSLIMEEI